MTVRTAVTQTFLRQYSLPFVALKDGLQLQVLPNISTLARCKKHHYAAFIRDTGMLVVWEDDPSDVIRRTETIERQLVEMLWKLDDSHNPLDEKMYNIKGMSTVDVNVTEVSSDAVDEEAASTKPRKTVIYQSFLVAAALILVISTLAIGWRRIVIELSIDKSYTRLALLAATPFQVSVSYSTFSISTNV